MYDGAIKPVEQIEEGELVMGPDSQPRTVRDLHRGYGPLYRVTPTKGDPYVVNQNHILSLKMSRECAGGFHSVTNIPVYEYLQKSAAFKRDAMGWRAPADWPEQQLPLDPYLFGCWLGDGTANKPQITTPDGPVMEAMMAYVGVNEGMRIHTVAVAGKAFTLDMRRPHCGGTKNEFTEALRDLGVHGNKHIPWIYRVSSREQRLQLLAGLLDSDGYLHANCFDIVQKNEGIANDVAFIARSLGLAAYVKPCEKSCDAASGRFTGIYHRVIISGDTDMIPNRVRRKKASARQQRKNVLVTGIKVEPIGDGEFFGFELDGDHLFLLGDFTVTHNTSFGAMLPKPIFIQSRGETGLETLISNGRLPEVPHFPEVQAWPELLSALRALIDQQHEYKTLVIDTVNGVERLCSEYICATQFKGDWSNFNAYGRGYENAVAEWINLLSALDKVRDARKMVVLLLCHTQVRKFKNPEGGDYGRYSPDMNEKMWGATHKWADVVLFGNFQTVVDKQGKAAGGENRILCCTRTAAYDAKNRVGLPDVLDMGGSPQEAWKAFAAALMAGKQQTKEEGK